VETLQLILVLVIIRSTQEKVHLMLMPIGDWNALDEVKKFRIETNLQQCGHRQVSGELHITCLISCGRCRRAVQRCCTTNAPNNI